MPVIRFMTEISYNAGSVLAAKQSFERDHPDVTIIYQQASDFHEMLTAYRSEEPPDIIESGGFQVSNSDDLFIDLNPYVAATAGLEEDLYAGLLRVTRSSGILPGLPVEVSSPIIIYSKESFDEAGLAYPADDWSWDDMIRIASRLTERDEGGAVTRYGLQLGVDVEWLEPFVMRNGGAYISPDGATARGYADSPATIETYQLIVDAFRLHRVVQMPNEASNGEQRLAAPPLRFNFSWNVNHDELHQGKIGAVQLPQMPGRIQTNMVYMGGAGITAKSASPDIAWTFLKHYLHACHSWMPPIFKSQAAQRGLSEHPVWSKYLQQLEHVQLSGYYLSKKWNASRQLVNEDIFRMVEGGADVAQTLRSWARFA